LGFIPLLSNALVKLDLLCILIDLIFVNSLINHKFGEL
jgi:hypothetical protein